MIDAEAFFIVGRMREPCDSCHPDAKLPADKMASVRHAVGASAIDLRMRRMRTAQIF